MAKVNVSTPAQLIAAVAHMLGFHPTDSLVVVPVGGRIPVARIDIPHDALAALTAGEALANAYTAHPGQVALVAFTDDLGEHAQATVAVIAALLPSTSEVVLTLLTDGRTWLEPTTGGEGPVTPDQTQLIAAEMAYAGVTTPLDSRDQLAAKLARTDPIDPEQFTATLDRLTRDENTAQAAAAHGQAIIDTARQTQLALTTDEAVLLLDLASATAWRIHTYLPATRQAHARADLALWLSLAQQCPIGYDRTGVLELCAFHAWLSGDGALAWVALDHAAAEGTPGHIHDLVTQRLTTAADPHQWDPTT